MEAEVKVVSDLSGAGKSKRLTMKAEVKVVANLSGAGKGK